MLQSPNLCYQSARLHREAFTLHQKKDSFTDWLGFRSNFDFTKARTVGKLLGFFLSIAAILMVAVSMLSFGLLIVTLIGIGPFSEDETGAAIRNVGLVVAAIVGFPFIVWRSVVAQKNAATAEQAQITDRLNKAVLGIGSEKSGKRVLEKPKYQKDDKGGWLLDEKSKPVPALRPDGAPLVDREQFEETKPNIEVRVGAILSLERIARDSSRDYIQIMALIATYIRENSSTHLVASQLQDQTFEVREDIKAAATLLFESHGRWEGLETPAISRNLRPDLQNVNLDGFSGAGSNLESARLDWSSWVNADLGYSNLKGVLVHEGCDFSGTEFESCCFDEASLRKVKISRETSLMDATFRNAWVGDINFYHDNASHIDFSYARLDCGFHGALVVSSKFSFASIGGCRFDRSGLYDVDFEGVKGWAQAQFDGAFGISAGEGRTIIPEGAVYPAHWVDLSNLGREFDSFATFEHEWQKWKLSPTSKRA